MANQLQMIVGAGALAGFVATAGMALCLSAFSRYHIVHVNLVRSVGRLVAPASENPQAIGWAFHWLAGMLFGVLYTAVVVSTGAASQGVVLTLVVSSMLGFGHGFVVSIMLSFLVGGAVSSTNVREEGFAVAGLYFLAHLVYGGLIGAVISLIF